MGADVSLRSLDGSSAADWAERFNFLALSEKLKREESMQSENVDPARARPPASLCCARFCNAGM
jgi:hypothetical protein